VPSPWRARTRLEYTHPRLKTCSTVPSVAPYFSGILKTSDDPLIYSGKIWRFGILTAKSKSKADAVKERPTQEATAWRRSAARKELPCAFILRGEEQRHIPFKEEQGPFVACF
jgi:hypothetical protein